ncbi:archaellin/type IV pilin N-terminal domain-containing protein [Thermosphaera aggregans]|uniref:Flagellin n=1 Tax=Thermosphaera aggregans (strain DSM 11486 / M11TL) TaxID=633148 RepID=D5U1N2_THEAM|nr:archaellin/type IV pilin N-terminal domain-containing protein [Thermosphaera aggregans]ADG91032.1 flagellin [Thermosphaera aggregans DSM 11486]
MAKKGIVGIEAAIVLIAFVIVAAALAFVVINMGMYTTQKSKEVMQQGLNEATTALEVDGSVLGYVIDTDAGAPVVPGIQYIYIPLKVSPGQLAVDFSSSKIDIVINLPSGAYSKINSGSDPVHKTGTVGYISDLRFDDEIDTVPVAKVYIIQGDGDNVLEPGEKFILVIGLPSSMALEVYEKFTVEIRPLQGAPLIVERSVPPTLTVGELVNLG